MSRTRRAAAQRARKANQQQRYVERVLGEQLLPWQREFLLRIAHFKGVTTITKHPPQR